jgi:DNA repair photolyase
MDSKSPIENNNKTSIGKAEILYKSASSILTPASGFMNLYDFTLNPYSGCSFGCTYCYAAFFSRTQEQRDHWGSWVMVKENAVEQLRKKRKKPLVNKTIYMSSVTDPYQPIERKLCLTRSILQELADYHQVRLVIQTRSPLITRDIDLFKQFANIQVNMTITTDSEAIRKVFEPVCSSNADRLEAIKTVSEAGVGTCITMTPLLPVDDIEKFINALQTTGVKNFVVQPFHAEKGKFVAGTRDAAMDLLKLYDWSNEKYKAIEKRLKDAFPVIGIGKIGFKPV